jgi:putative ABC transport system substrate-binding protein
VNNVLRAIALTLAAAALFIGCEKKEDLPLVAIANYGPLKDLELSLEGLKAELRESGFRDGETVRISVVDIAFDHALIPQTIANLKNSNPKVMVVVSTPLAQFARGKILDIPLVFHAITDPVAAGLLKDRGMAGGNITGSSDKQNLEILLGFAKDILPEAKVIGLMCLSSDSNDAALLAMMEKAAPSFGLSVLSIAVDQLRDIPVRMQEFRDRVDFIYVGASGLHAAMPSIAAAASKMHIPVLDSEEQSVRDGLALGSFGVNYESVGRNAGKLVVKILQGIAVADLPPIFPAAQDHRCFVNKKLANKFGIRIPDKAIVVE